MAIRYSFPNCGTLPLHVYHSKTGGIVFGPRGCHEVESVLKALATCGIPYEVLDASEASRRVPQLNLPHGYECVLEEDGGILSAQGAVKTMQVYNNHFHSTKMQPSLGILYQIVYHL